MTDILKELACIMAILGLVFAPIAAWVTHVVICIQAQTWIFLLVGALAPPVGVIHGVGHWFGAW